MDKLPTLKKFGEQLDLLKKLIQEGDGEQGELIAQTIFENYVFARDGYLRLEDDLIVTRNSLKEKEERLESLESRFRETIADYKTDFQIFRRFSNAQGHINALNSIAGLIELIEKLTAELGAYRIAIVLDRESCSGLPSGDVPTFYLKGCMRYIDATLSRDGNRVFIGPISKMMRPDIFFGDPDITQDCEGSCFAFGLMDKYRPEEMIGLFSFYDPSPERYRPEMGTDFLEHFCSSLASTLTDVINHQRAEQLRDDVARITRHDLKTPLNAVINLPHLLLASDTDPARIEMIKAIQDAGYKMLGVINSSYDIYSMETGNYVLKSEDVDLLKIIARIRMDLLDMIEAKGLDLEVLRNGLPAAEERFIVKGEELLLFSMLCNLLKNSFEAAPVKSTVSIMLSDEDGTMIELRNQGAVPKSVRDNFFEKYVTHGKPDGTGLGTYSAKLIAAAHGGSIRMSTSEEDGTTVSIRL